MIGEARLPRILLVHDHRDTVEMTTHFLAKLGYVVIPAYSMAEARAAAANHRCDVLISDIGLPDGNGIELIRELKGQYAIVGIMVSGSVDDGAAIESEGL